MNKTLQALILTQNQIGDAGAASIGDALTYVVFFGLGGNFFFCHATRFFGKILGQYFMKFHGFFIACSTNKTLQVLVLVDNQIGDMGAGSIGGALMYV